MAEVFLACQRGPAGYEKRLVIKRILPERAQDPGLLRRFFEEARLHAGLSHGNLVPIFDFGRVGNEYFLALELVDGCDLAHLLEALPDHRLSPELCAYVGAELCHALVHVHRQGLVHRDVTPRNVLLSRDGEVKLADFGVALGGAGPTAVAGTEGFMAPEQARGEVDGRADQYSVGAVLTRALGPECGAPIASIASRAMAADPADRFADASELAEALESVAQPRAATARLLAKLVREHAADLATSGVAPAPPSRAVRATYYRDDTTAASVVDEILTPRRTGRRGLVAGLLAAGVLGALGLGRMARSVKTTPRPVTLARSEPAPVGPLPTPAPEPATPPAPRPVPPSPAPAPSQGSLEVVCEPWCVVDVDGTRRGEDGRLHRLRLPFGRHRVTATRLDDRQTKTATIDADAKSVEFVFD